MNRRVGYTCNALSFPDFIRFLVALFPFVKPRGRELLVNEISRQFGLTADQVFLFGAARMALYSFLKSLKLSMDDEVIVTGYTCLVVPNAILFSGASIRYVDIDPETFNIDTKKLCEAITPKTRAVVICHNFGITWEDAALVRNQFPHVLIVEDAAHALGSRNRQGVPAGLLGDVSFFSFEYSKPITTGMGGVLLINRADLIPAMKHAATGLSSYPYVDRIRIFITLCFHFLGTFRFGSLVKRGFFFLGRKLRLVYGTPPEEFEGRMPPHYPVRLTDGFAYLGYLQFRHYDRVANMKRSVASEYYRRLHGIAGTREVYSDLYCYVRYPLVVEPKHSITVSHLRKRIRERSGLEAGDWFNDVVHPAGSYRYGYVSGSCPNGEWLSQHMINLPISMRARPKARQVERVRDILLEIYAGER